MGQDFSTADKGKKFAKGGLMAGIKEARMEPAKMQKVRTAAPSRDGLAERGRTKGTQIKMAGNSIGTGAAMKKGGMAKMKKK